MARFRSPSGKRASSHEYLNARKALEVLLYVSQHSREPFHVLMTIYFADKMHLDRYGRAIAGDTYMAMETGPIPSGAYDLLMDASGGGTAFDEKIIDAHPEAAIEAREDCVLPKRAPSLEYLSESDQACLDKAIAKYARMDAAELRRIAQQERAYRKTRRGQPIPWSDIIALDLPKWDEDFGVLEGYREMKESPSTVERQASNA